MNEITKYSTRERERERERAKWELEKENEIGKWKDGYDNLLAEIKNDYRIIDEKKELLNEQEREIEEKEGELEEKERGLFLREGEVNAIEDALKNVLGIEVKGDFKEKLVVIQQELAKWKNHACSTRDDSLLVADLRRQLEEVEREANEAWESLQTEKEELTKEKKTLTQSNTDLHQKLETALNYYQQIKKKLQKQEDVNQKLTVNLDQAEVARDNNHTKITKLTAKNQQLAQQDTENKRQLKEFKEQNNQLKTDLQQAAEAKNNTLQILRNLQAEKQELEKKLTTEQANHQGTEKPRHRKPTNKYESGLCFSPRTVKFGPRKIKRPNH